MDKETRLKQFKFGILGGGFVGQILKKYYTEALIYDLNEEYDKLTDVLNQEIIFVAFNLKDNCRSEESYKVLADYAKKAPDGRIFIVKSTFVPGTTDRLQEEFPQHFFIYNIEFLTEATAWFDFVHPNMQILGVPDKCLKLLQTIPIFDLMPDAPVKRVISPRDAEVMKHATNSFYSTKVIFFNQLYDACQKLNADYDTVRELMMEDPRIGNSHSIIQHAGYRGFGGKCLPKDSEALADVTEFPLLDNVIKYNNELRQEV